MSIADNFREPLPPADPIDAAYLRCVHENFGLIGDPVAEGILANHFETPDCGELWELFCELHHNGLGDPAIVKDRIRAGKSPHLTMSRLLDILNCEAIPENAGVYARTIAQRAAKTHSSHPPSPQEKENTRFAVMAAASRVAMGEYSMMEPHEARSLLPREIWRGILREGMLVLLGGESKAKKSWFSLSLAMAAVADADFLGMAISAPMDGPRRVRFLDFELLEGNVMSRFLSMSERFQAEPEWRAIWSQIEIFHHRERMTESMDWIGYVCHHCDQLKRGDILIADCLQALDSGDANDPSAVRKALGRLQAAATRNGVVLLVVDHFNKSTEARGKNRLSGSMAKAATPDAILLLESEKQFIKLSFELRMDPPRDPLTLAFDSPSEGFRLVTEEEEQDRRETASESRRCERLATMFPDRFRRYSKAEIAANIRRTPDTALNWIKEFSDAIETHVQGPKEPHLYSLKSDA